MESRPRVLSSTFLYLRKWYSRLCFPAAADANAYRYSPIGKGMLSGRFKTLDDIPKGDHRHFWPRFYPENFDNNVKLVDKVRKLAEKKGCTPAQLAINWVRSLSGKSGMPQFIPLPGSTNDTRVRENAFLTDLTVEELEVIDGILANFTTAGDRYPAGFPTEG
jgi:pyridoxine 4-dehydrogenase